MMFPEWLYTIDILFVAAVLCFGISGFQRGFAGELAHLLALACLMAGFFFYYPQLTEAAAENIERLPPWADGISVSVLLILGAILIFFVAQIVFKAVIKSQMTDFSNKLVGLLAGMARGALISLAFISGLSLFGNEALDRAFSERSVVGSWVYETMNPWLFPKVMNLPLVQVIGRKVEESGLTVPELQMPDFTTDDTVPPPLVPTDFVVPDFTGSGQE